MPSRFIDARPYLDSVQLYAEAILHELCEPAERTGSREDRSLIKLCIRKETNWLKLKPGPRKGRDNRIASADTAARLLEAIEAARRAHKKVQDLAGDAAAEALFEAACDVGKLTGFLNTVSQRLTGLKSKRSRQKGALKTNAKLTSKRPDYVSEVRALRGEMSLTQARQQVAEKYGVTRRTVEYHTRNVSRGEKR